MFANARRIGRPVLVGVVCAQVLATLFLVCAPALGCSLSVSITVPGNGNRFLVHKPGLRDVRIIVKGTVSGGTAPYTVEIYTQPPGSQDWSFKGSVTPDANRNWNFCCWDTSASVRGGHKIKAKVIDAQGRTAEHIIGVVLFKMIWPVSGTVTGEFNPPSHYGIDIAASCFTQIQCAEDGTTESCLSDPGGYGYHIKANHGTLYVQLVNEATTDYRSATVRSRYAHLPGPADNDCYRATACDGSPQNTALSQGDQVGLVGHSGSSSCAHLHFEVLEGSTAWNPRIYLP